MKKLLVVTTVAIMLAGCGDSFTGKYKFDNTNETMIIKGDGTCVDDLNGVKTACTWKKVGNGKYEIQMKTFLGDVAFDAVSKDKNTYEVSAYGATVTMRK